MDSPLARLGKHSTADLTLLGSKPSLGDRPVSSLSGHTFSDSSSKKNPLLDRTLTSTVSEYSTPHLSNKASNAHSIHPRVAGSQECPVVLGRRKLPEAQQYSFSKQFLYHNQNQSPTKNTLEDVEKLPFNGLKTKGTTRLGGKATSTSTRVSGNAPVPLSTDSTTRAASDQSETPSSSRRLLWNRERTLALHRRFFHVDDLSRRINAYGGNTYDLNTPEDERIRSLIEHSIAANYSNSRFQELDDYNINGTILECWQDKLVKFLHKKFGHETQLKAKIRSLGGFAHQLGPTESLLRTEVAREFSLITWEKIFENEEEDVYVFDSEDIAYRYRELASGDSYILDSLRYRTLKRHDGDGKTGQPEPETLHPTMFMHYTISEDRTGDRDAVASKILAALGSRGRRRNTLSGNSATESSTKNDDIDGRRGYTTEAPRTQHPDDEYTFSMDLMLRAHSGFVVTGAEVKFDMKRDLFSILLTQNQRSSYWELEWLVDLEVFGRKTLLFFKDEQGEQDFELLVKSSEDLDEIKRILYE